ncbi:hypothetical protein Tsubulata_012216 [Turnera subulata]|uniref:RRM domain-containing protein n=1 Tax=Turnera subulata TaxID=218843 RepID=A0A9Q0FIW7_9ROSI|nr:hypothetical protein Tsubulata_012216 [Turnera subulata]
MFLPYTTTGRPPLPCSLLSPGLPLPQTLPPPRIPHHHTRTNSTSSLPTIPCSPFTTATGCPPLLCSPLSPGLPNPQNPPPPRIPHHHTRTNSTPSNHLPIPYLHPTSPLPIYKNQWPLVPLPIPPIKTTSAHPTLSPTFNSAQQNPQIPIPKPQHFSKWSRKQILNIINNHHVTNRYIENLSLQWTAVEIHFILSKFSEVIDVFILTKHATNGKCFGFVRFRACHDIQRLISSINLIKVENSSLQASIARNRNHPRQNPANNNTNHKTLPPPIATLHKSFADATKNPSLSSQTIPRDKASISFSPLKYETDWLSSCAFGVLSEPLDTQIVLQLFLKHGLSVSISDFGGDSVLIKFPSLKELFMFLESNHDWPADTFDLLRPWQKNDGPSNRKVWIRAKGIPLHAWSKGFFHTLVSRFGSLIAVDPVIDSKSKLDFAYLQIITTVFKPISWDISALIEGISFQIHIDEIPQPPSSVTLFRPSLLNTHESSKPSSTRLASPKTLSPQSASNHLATTPGGVFASPSGHHNSDPFQLLPLIENTNQPKNVCACSNVLKPQNGLVVPACNPASSCSLLKSKPSVGPTHATNTCHSPYYSSTDSSSPDSHILSNSHSGSSSFCPIISFNNSAPPPSFPKTHYPSIKRAQSLPSLHFSDYPPSLPKPSPNFALKLTKPSMWAIQLDGTVQITLQAPKLKPSLSSQKRTSTGVYLAPYKRSVPLPTLLS